jgi:starch synthase
MAVERLNILYIAAEVAPFAKVGGLADVAGSLPKALKEMGHDVRIAMPGYNLVMTNPEYAAEDILPGFSVPIRAGVTERAYVKRTCLHVGDPADDPPAEDAGTADPPPNAVPVYLIANTPPYALPGTNAPPHPGYFQQAVSSQTVYTFEPEPYIFFCRAVLEMLAHLEPVWKPDILHCNDWHAGLVPVFARTFYADTPAIADAVTVFTIHNLAYQGNFGREHWKATGLPDSLYNINGLEFYGKWSFMKGGLIFAEKVNTVSPRYAREIQTPDYGSGLHGLMQTLNQQGKLSGILNGIDYTKFNPATDPHIPCHFSVHDPSGKAQCKAALQAELGLPQDSTKAVIGIVSRLAEQKGLDLMTAAMEPILALPAQFVLLGTGDAAYEAFFTGLQARYPRQVRARIAFDVDLAQRIYAGSDLFLMPSRFEPCGLGQMISLRYGTIPIVRATGGLADTVHDYDPNTKPEGNGFVFRDYTARALLKTVQRAVAAYGDKASWQTLVLRALGSDFSWERSARKYAGLYTAAQAEPQKTRFLRAANAAPF